MAEVYNGNVPGLSMDPVGNQYRGITSDWWNATDIAEEDWQRAEQSANNALARDMYYLNAANAFNAEQAEISRQFDSAEAQKQRAFEQYNSDTAYQRAVSDMKIAGINPIVGLGFANNGASTPTGSAAHSSYTANSVSARSSPANSGGRSAGSSGMNVISSILSLVAGLITKGATSKTMLAASAQSAASAFEGKKYQADMGMKRDEAWRNYYDSKNRRNKKR